MNLDFLAIFAISPPIFCRTLSVPYGTSHCAGRQAHKHISVIMLRTAAVAALLLVCTAAAVAAKKEDAPKAAPAKGVKAYDGPAPPVVEKDEIDGIFLPLGIGYAKGEAPTAKELAARKGGKGGELGPAALVEVDVGAGLSTAAAVAYNAPASYLAGGAHAGDVQHLRAHAANRRVGGVVATAACPPAAAALFPALTCQLFQGWYYYHDTANHGRMTAVLGRPIDGGGEKTTDFESDLVRIIGGTDWDHAGHLRAKAFGGLRAPVNVFPQGAVSNTMGQWRSAERKVKSIMTTMNCSPAHINIDIRLVYTVASPRRPTGGTYSVMIANAGCAANVPGMTVNVWRNWNFLNSVCGVANE